MSDQTQQRTPDRESAALGQSLRALPPGIWALGLGAMFMDMSSELVHSRLPVFMVTGPGASMVTIDLAVHGGVQAEDRLCSLGLLSSRDSVVVKAPWALTFGAAATCGRA